MKRAVKGSLLLVMISLVIASCKKDAPNYPPGTLEGSTFSYSLDQGQTTQTVDQGVIFQVIKPGNAEAPYGNIGIYATPPDGEECYLLAGAAATGTFDISEMSIGDYKKADGAPGNVTITEYKIASDGISGSVKGTFKVDLTDPDGNVYHDVTGSFNVKQ